MYPNMRPNDMKNYNMNLPPPTQQSQPYNYPPNNFNMSNLPKQNMNNLPSDPLMRVGKTPLLKMQQQGYQDNSNLVTPQPTKTLKPNSSVFIPNNMTSNVSFFPTPQQPPSFSIPSPANPLLPNMNLGVPLPAMNMGITSTLLANPSPVPGVSNASSSNPNPTPPILTPNPILPMSSTPPLNNLNSYKIYPNFKQPTPGLSIGQNNGILGFSMATPPPTLNLNEMGFNLPVGFNTMINPNSENDKELEKVVGYILNLRDHDKREEALQELSKKRENFSNLAPYLWYSVGTLAILLQEIVTIYPSLAPPQLGQNLSNRVCNVLGLLQCLALHADTRSYFLQAHIPLFLYPFLNTSTKSKPFENLRVSSLGVIGALVKGDDSEAIHFLMQTEIIPLCLRIMKRGMDLSRTVATFIVQKILHDEKGLSYISQTPDRFYAVTAVLQTMIDELVEGKKDDQRLIRHIIKCYLKLSENDRSNEILRKCLPEALKDPNINFITDENVKRWHSTLLSNLGFTKNQIPLQELKESN